MGGVGVEVCVGGGDVVCGLRGVGGVGGVGSGVGDHCLPTSEARVVWVVWVVWPMCWVAWVVWVAWPGLV